MTIKQVLYTRATETRSSPQDIHTPSQSQSQDNTQENEVLLIFTLSKSKGAKQKEHKKEVSSLLQKYV